MTLRIQCHIPKNRKKRHERYMKRNVFSRRLNQIIPNIAAEDNIQKFLTTSLKSALANKT